MYAPHGYNLDVNYVYNKIHGIWCVNAKNIFTFVLKTNNITI